MQFDQSDLMLPSLEYYQLGFNHPIIQSYYNVLLNVHVMRHIMYLYDNANIVKQESVNVIECFRNQIQ